MIIIIHIIASHIQLYMVMKLIYFIHDKPVITKRGAKTVHRTHYAQIMCWAVAANHYIRDIHIDCFNDSFVALYVTACVYSVAKDRIELAAFMLTMSIGIKTGPLIIIPAFLGWVQYRRGLPGLFRSIAIIILVQVIFSLPFVCDPVAKSLGFKIGAQTSVS